MKDFARFAGKSKTFRLGTQLQFTMGVSTPFIIIFNLLYEKFSPFCTFLISVHGLQATEQHSHVP